MRGGGADCNQLTATKGAHTIGNADPFKKHAFVAIEQLSLPPHAIGTGQVAGAMGLWLCVSVSVSVCVAVAVCLCLCLCLCPSVFVFLFVYV